MNEVDFKKEHSALRRIYRISIVILMIAIGLALAFVAHIISPNSDVHMKNIYPKHKRNVMPPTAYHINFIAAEKKYRENLKLRNSDKYPETLSSFKEMCTEYRIGCREYSELAYCHRIDKKRKAEESIEKSSENPCPKGKIQCLSLALHLYANRLSNSDRIRKLFQQTCNENEKVGCFEFYLFENQEGYQDNAKRIAQLNPQAVKEGQARYASWDLPDRPQIDGC